MELRARASGVLASQNGKGPPVGDISKSRATRYLSAAAHMRRPMLPDEVLDPGMVDVRPPLPVGRAYALRVLLGPGGLIPMSAVDMRKVKRHCLIALLQTVIRDLAAMAVVVTCIVIEPWGTPIVLGIVAAIIISAGRTWLSSLLLAAVIVIVTLALINGSTSARISLGIPLACLSGCFIIYLADVLLSIHYVRKLWQQPTSRNQSRFADKSRAPSRTFIFRESARSESQRWLYVNATVATVKSETIAHAAMTDANVI